MKKHSIWTREFGKSVVSIALPISLQSLITIGVNMIDNIMVGSLGENAISGASLSNQFFNLFYIACMGLAMGGSIMTARYWGSDDHFSLKKTVSLVLRICSVLALLFTMVTALFPQGIMRLYTNDTEVIAQGVLYLKWQIPCYLFFGLSLTCTNLLRSVGQVKIPLYSSIGAFAIKAVMNYGLIFGNLCMPALALEGAAISTMLARCFEFLFICGYFILFDRKIAYRWKDFTQKYRSVIREYINVGMPVFCSDVIMAVANTLLAMIMGRIGKSFISAYSITTVTLQFSTVLLQGLSNAACILTGHTLGKGDAPGTVRQTRAFLLLALAVGFLASATILVIKDGIIGLYNITDETRSNANQLMYAISIFVVFQAMNYVLSRGILRGGGDTQFLMASDAVFLWTLSIPLAYLSGLVWKSSAFTVYALINVDLVCKTILCLFRLRSGKWMKKINRVDA